MKVTKTKRVIVLILSVILISVLFAGCSGGGGGNGSSGSNQKPTTGNLAVAVVDDAGNTVSGATVSMDSTSGTTDSNGMYVFKDVKAGSYTIKATKDGYEDAQKDITVSAGKDQSVTLTLKKKQEQTGAEPLKDPSKVKSYRSIIYTESSGGSENKSKTIIEQDDYGKKQHIVVYEGDGKKSFELYVVGDKAKISQGNGKWMEMPGGMIGQLTKGYIETFKSLQNEAYGVYNGWVKDPTGEVSYKVERAKQETVNGYSTTKYVLHGKEKTETGVELGTITLWVINKGPYKDYTTRLQITSVDSSGKTEKITIDTLDFGKDMNISLP